HLTDEDWEAVYKLREEKYDNWDWNYGKSPKFNLQRTKRFDIGEIDLRLDVEKGLIKNLKIYGDFFGREPVETLENIFKGARYDKDEIINLLNPIEIDTYF